MLAAAIARLLHPSPIRFDEALPVAVIGLLVNLASAKLLDHGHDHAHHDHGHAHDHGHDHAHHHAHHDHAHHDHAHDHAHDPVEHQDHAHHDHVHVHAHHDHKRGHHDHNLKAAYLHVVADALTSVMAIGALLSGRYFGLNWLDPAMGIVGGVVIVKWSIALVRSSARQLLDVVPRAEAMAAIRECLETDGDTRVADLHLWELGPGRMGCIVKVVAAEPRETAYYRERIKAKVPVSHLTVEVHRCLIGHA
jgi:cation diffusion facilitator family transporter